MSDYLTDIEARIMSSCCEDDGLTGDDRDPDCTCTCHTIADLREALTAAEARNAELQEALDASVVGSRVVALTERMREKEARVRELEREVSDSRTAADSEAKEVNRLAERVRELEEALGFYAAPGTYQQGVHPHHPGYLTVKPIDTDNGQRARDTLGAQNQRALPGVREVRGR